MPSGRVPEASGRVAPTRRRLLAGAALAALSVPLASCCMPWPLDWLDSQPVRVVKAFYRHVEKLEIQKALELVSMRLRNQLGDGKLRAALEKQGRELREKGGVDKIEIVREETTGDVAFVYGVVVYGNGEREDDKTKLVRENGEWRLDADK